MGTAKQQFSCYIIGEESLVIQCAELILKNDHHLLGIVSSNEQIKEWANNQKVKYISSNSKFESSLLNDKFDYLFSIVNHHIIPKALLKKPQQLAINYHDALLPKYAGVHATSWAILNKEQQHGITWHVMTDKLDAGDILKQQAVTVNNKETALSLNLKCYQAAINSFAELIDELASNTYVRTPQDLTLRTYYAFNKKPMGNSLIKWNDDAENIYRLHRALHFGPNYINRLSLPKFIIGKQAYIVEKIILSKKQCKEKASTVLNITKKSLEISTKTNNISLSDIKTIDGHTISIKDLCKNHRLIKGNKLPLPTKNLLEKLKEFSEASFKDERFWIKELEHFKPATIPFLPAQHGTTNYFSHTSVWKIKINNKLQKNLKKCYTNTPIEAILLTVWLIYLYRIGNQENLGIALTYFELKQKISGLENFVAKQIPFITDLNDNMNFADALSLVSKKYNQLEQHLTFLKDVTLRHPQLAEHQYCPAINTIIQDNKTNNKFYSRIPINFIISPDGQLELFKARQYSDKNLQAVLLNISGHLDTLLEDIVQNPNQPISKIALLTPAEQQKILIDWNNTKTDYPRDKTVHQLFEEQVEKTPNNIAVVFEDKQLTYRELNEKANQLAHYLRKQGVKAETLVAICVERSLEMIIGILGIIKAGGAYVPIDPDYPQARIDYILKDTKSPVIITQTHLLKKLKRSSAKIVDIEKTTQFFKITNQNLVNVSKPNNLIYVLYTSGTTGEPKGVLIKHNSVINCLTSIINLVKISKADIFCAITSLTFDVAALDYYIPFSIGAKCVIVSNHVQKDVITLIKIINNNHISIMQATPSIWNTLIHQGWKVNLNFKILTAGEALHQELGMKLKKRGSLFNIYGPTETTIYATLSKVNSMPIVIGKPIANINTYVLDRNNQLVPIGITGELYLSGDGLSKGYLNKEMLTRKKFIPSYFGSSYSQYIYRTSDLVRYLPDGNIEYIDRSDNQVKVRGFRIELSEIDNSLCKHPQIAQANTLMQVDKNKHKQLIAFIIKQKNLQKKDSELNTEKIQGFLRKHIPGYAVPSLYYEVDRFPLTSSGKIDREKLITFQQHPLPPSKKEIILPQNELEVLLANIWQKVLKLKVVSIHDNFFSLGGDSILAIQIISKVRQAGWILSAYQIFTYPTVAELASKIVKLKPIIETSINTSQFFSLSPIQYWFFNQPLVNKEQFSHICLLDVNLPINIMKLEKTFEILKKKYGALNVTFNQTKDGWQHCIKNWKSIKYKNLHVAKISNQTSEDSKKFIEQWTYNLQSEFNLTNGPLFQAVILIDKTSSQAKLLIAAHHLIIDGVSWRILLEDLETLYYKKDFSNTKKIIPSHTFKNWVGAISAYAQKHNFISEKNYWKKISNISYKIPLDFELGPNLEKNTDIIQTCLDVEETYLLFKKAPKVYNIRFHKLLIAALTKTLANWTKSKAILLSLETHGREELFNQVDISNTIGWFTNLFPALINSKKLDLDEYVQDIDIQLNKIASKSLTYGILRYLKKEGYQLNINPPISFNYWGQFNKIFSNASQFNFNWLRLVSAPENPRAHLIDIEAVINHGQLFIKWTYSQNFHLQSTIARLANELVANLKNLLINCGSNKAHNQLLTGFPPINLTTEQLKKLVEENEDANIEKIYPLTSMQKGLLFHSLYSTNSEVYCVQLIWALENINFSLLQKAFQLLIHRHGILRAHFKWEGLAEPIQIIQKQAELLWQEYDWCELSAETQQQRLNFFLKTDRETGFTLNKAPLLRITIIKKNNSTSQIILTLHHILIDGWCLPILFNELGKIYQALIHQKNINLLDPPNFAYYIEWLQKQDSKIAKNFWKNYLKGFTAPTDLVVIKNKIKKSEQDSLECSHKIVTLSRPLTLQIHQFCKHHRLTLSTLFQGIWGLLLNRYSQNDDIVFGITVSGRTPEIPDAESMIGLMINTLPLRIQFNQDLTAINYLHHIQKTFSELVMYGYTPLSDIQHWSEVPTHSTLFDSILAIENYPIEKIQGLNIDFHNIEIIDPTHYPIALAVILDKQISLKFNYNSNAIQYDVLQRLCNHVKTLLYEILSNHDKSIHKLNILTAAEKQQIIYEWNQTETDYPRNKTVHQLFEEQVEKTPDNIAIVYENEQLTYRELNEKANQLAHYLLAQGIKKETFVAICIGPSLETIVGILGILKAGGVYVPIDPTYPSTRIKFILDDSDAKFLLTNPQLAEKFKKIYQSILKIVILNLKDAFFIKELTKNISTITKSYNLIYITYTSGSTGNPKGILISHKNVVRLVKNTNYLNITCSDNVAHASNIAFDASTFEIWGALLNGAKLIIFNKNTILSLHSFANALVHNKISILWLTSSLFNHIYTHQPDILYTIDKLLIGGEALDYTIIKNFISGIKTKPIQFINGYGPTECTTFSTYYKIDNSIQTQNSIPIGKPISNTQCYILDKNLIPLPIGICGVLYIGGEGLAQGYLNNSLLTKEKFLPNPFNKNVKTKIYKTDDLARWLPNGNIEFIGRLDDQVKIRGFRIEPGEIQTQLEKHPSIKQAFVVCRENSNKEKYLIAYIIADKDNNLVDLKDLQVFLQKFLPDYMIPADIIKIDKFPITPNGKLDLNFLAKTNSSQIINKNYIPAKTKEERLIAKMWSEVLNIQKISIEDNFFELGGHSLSALDVLSRIYSHYNLELPIRILYNNPTIKMLTKEIISQKLEKQSFSTAFCKSLRNRVDSCLIPLKITGNKKPLFLIHPVGGTIFWYLPLIKHIDIEQPVYGMQDPGIESEIIPFQNVNEMASYYVELIRAKQPNGPYFLGGASGGAIISIEITRQLQNIGEKVSFLALLDGWAPYPDILRNKEIFEANMRRQYHNLKTKFIAKGIDSADKLLNLQWKRAQQIANYTVPLLDQKLTLFKAETTMPIFQAIDAQFNHWENHSTHPIELYLTPGNHETMFEEPNVQILVQHLNECLHRYNNNINLKSLNLENRKLETKTETLLPV